jgi:hypothetical protein
VAELHVNVTKAATFNIDARVASAFGGAFHLEVDGKNVTGTLKFTNTGASRSGRRSASRA